MEYKMDCYLRYPVIGQLPFIQSSPEKWMGPFYFFDLVLSTLIIHIDESYNSA
jgi:hypothetical protein